MLEIVQLFNMICRNETSSYVSIVDLRFLATIYIGTASCTYTNLVDDNHDNG